MSRPISLTPPRDFSGEKYGRWTIVAFSHFTEHTANRDSMWLCRCECGNTKTIKRGSLTSGNSRSCGCLGSELVVLRNRKHIFDNESVPFNNLYRIYRNGAEKRGYEFAINKEEFKTLTKTSCFFCGLPPSSVVRSKWGDEYVYNGIDRLDNTLGYIDGNCAPCCKTCNRAKNDLPYDEFVAWIRRLADKNK